jgi:hypothetical protein
MSVVMGGLTGGAFAAAVAASVASTDGDAEAAKRRQVTEGQMTEARFPVKLNGLFKIHSRVTYFADLSFGAAKQRHGGWGYVP